MKNLNFSAEQKQGGTKIVLKASRAKRPYQKRSSLNKSQKEIQP